MPTSLILIAVLLAGTPAAAPGPEELAAQARSLAGNFQLSLQGELLASMKAAGTLASLDVCKAKAPAIAADAARGTGWTLARTALRTRNTRNAPDAWEREGLEEMQVRIARNEDPALVERYEIVQTDGRKVFRYMKAIVIAPPCLGCHGPEMKPAVTKRILELYPADQAVGYKVGAFRGAFTLTKPL